MTEISKSPERGNFQLTRHLEILANPESSEKSKIDAQQMVDVYNKWYREIMAQELTEDWKKNNMEYDLRTTQWILDKVRNSDKYAQNLYAAMCNMQFQKLDVLPILKEERWSCSWRHSGGIIADMQVKGDYIDWYCSGMGGLSDYDTDPKEWAASTGYVPEGTVTDEIREDLKKLGWIPMEWPDDE